VLILKILALVELRVIRTTKQVTPGEVVGKAAASRRTPKWLHRAAAGAANARERWRPEFAERKMKKAAEKLAPAERVYTLTQNI